MLSLIKVKDIHQCEDTDHVYAISEQARKRPAWSVGATWCPRASCWWPRSRAWTSKLYLRAI